MEAARVDRWLWAVRVYRTRTAATEACRGGHVRINGSNAKAAATVHAGDRVEVRVGDRQLSYEVLEIIDKRVGATAAMRCFIDHSPAPPPPQEMIVPFERDASSGRPTKRDRRRLDRLRRK